MVPQLGEVLWIVDLNRQSLDRVVPDIAAGRHRRDVRGGRLADDHGQVRPPAARAVRAPGRRGAAAADRRRCPTRSTSACCAPPAAELRERLPGSGRGRRERRAAARRASTTTSSLRGAPRPRRPRPRRPARRVRARPTRSPTGRRSIFAYTIKAWRLPTEGHPGNHSALLTRRAVASSSPASLGADPDDPWARVRAGLARGRAVRAGRASRLRASPPASGRAAGGPDRRSAAHTADAPRPSRRSGASSSTSRTRAPEVAAHVVTVSPDVASSTNLGGWINRVGIWNIGERIDWFADDTDTLVRWREIRARPAHRARHRRGQPRRAARRARRDLVARRPAAAADRHALRPVRQPRARAVVVRDVRGRPVDPRRHPLRRHARPGGRRAPVDHHAVDRPRAAALRRLGAGVRPGPRVDPAARARSRSARADGTSAYFRLTHAADRPGARRRCRTTRPSARTRRGRCSPAATACGAPREPPAVTLVGVGAVMPEVLAAAEDARAQRRSPSTSSA